MKVGDLVKRILNGREEVALIIKEPKRVGGGIALINEVTVLTRLGKSKWGVSEIEVVK